LIALAIWAPSLTRVQLSWVLAIGGRCQGSSITSVQHCRSLGSAFGASAPGAVMFGLLSVMDAEAGGLIFALVRQGPAVFAALPHKQQSLLQSEIAVAFRGVFLTVAGCSLTIVTAAATMPIRRL
jgi:hypothetical protein